MVRRRALRPIVACLGAAALVLGILSLPPSPRFEWEGRFPADEYRLAGPPISRGRVEAYLSFDERTWTYQTSLSIDAALRDLQKRFPDWRTTRIQKNRYRLTPGRDGGPQLILERWSEKDSGPVVYARSEQVTAGPFTRWMAKHVLWRFGVLPDPSLFKLALR